MVAAVSKVYGPEPTGTSNFFALRYAGGASRGPQTLLAITCWEVGHVIEIVHVQAAIEQAKAARATIAVIACVNPLGQLQPPNRSPELASGLPVVLVPGGVAERLKTGTVEVAFTATIVPGRAFRRTP